MMQQAFNAGVLAPWLDSRNDLEKYHSGLRLCRNFVVTPYGGLRRRAGTEYMSSALPTAGRLVSFQPTSENGYIVEFGVGQTRVYDNGVQVAQMDSPWDASEVYELQYEQVNDIMFVCHKNHPPHELRRTSTDWELEPAEYDYPPFLDYELKGVQVKVVATGQQSSQSTSSLTSGSQFSVAIPVDGAWQVDTVSYTTDFELEYSSDGGGSWASISTITSTGTISGTQQAGLLRLNSSAKDAISSISTTVSNSELGQGDTVNLTATADTFLASHVGSQMEITHRQETNEVRTGLTYSGISQPLSVQGKWSLSTTGAWYGTVKIERSLDSGATWEVVLTRTAYGDRNVSYGGTQDKKALMRVNFTSTFAQQGNSFATLEASDPEVSGRVLITAVASGASATGIIVEGVYNEEFTETWKHSAWSAEQGYPSAVCWHEGRIWYGGTKKQPSTLWASRVEDYWHFQSSTLDDGSFSRRINSTEQSDIRWLASKQYLFIGTSGAEWRGSSDADSGVITPSSFLVRKFSSYGSDSLPAVITGSDLLYVQRQARKVRRVSYSIQSDGYAAQDLSLLAVHVTMSGIRDVAYQSQRDSILWAVTGCGRLIGLTYDSGQNVYAWHIHTTAGEYESVACVYESGEEDSIYVTVNRDGVRMLERFLPEQYKAVEEGGLQDMLHTDSSVIYDGLATSTLGGLAHLEGKTVQVMADGAYVGDKTVTGGEVVLDVPSSKIKAGLPYTSLIETMPINFQTQEGSTAGEYKRVHEVSMRVWRSVICEVAPIQASEQWQELDQYERGLTDEDTTPAEGEIGNFEDWKISHKSGWDRDTRCSIRIAKPYPLNILAVRPKFAVSNGN